MRACLRLFSSLLALACAVTATAVAQSAQQWSLQGSLFAANAALGNTTVGGAGVELQLRYTPASVWSLGAGFQSTKHESGSEQLTLSGFFAEPRLAIDVGSDKVAPYLAGRVAILNEDSDLTNAPNASSGGFAIGAGAGLLVRATPKVNLDLGFAIVNQSFSDAKASNGATVEFKAFMGYIAKVGLSVGFGGK